MLAMACSYFGIWSQAKQVVQLPYWAVLTCGLSASLGVVFLDAGCVVTSCQNFQGHQGQVAGSTGCPAIQVPLVAFTFGSKGLQEHLNATF